MEKRKGPGVKFPPPIVFLVAFLMGLWLEGAMYRLRLWDAEPIPRPLIAVGLAIVLAGAVFVGWGIVTFRRHQTAIIPFRAASTLVRSGPYRFTRNPMYLGMTLAHLGASVALNAMWPIILLPMALVVLFKLVIAKEERHLWEMFGNDYVEYRRQVRRWI